MSLFKILLVVLVLVVLFMELSKRVSTKSIWQKIGLSLVLVGALVWFQKANVLLPLGVIIYFVSITYLCYKAKRRKDDGNISKPQ